MAGCYAPMDGHRVEVDGAKSAYPDNVFRPAISIKPSEIIAAIDLHTLVAAFYGAFGFYEIVEFSFLWPLLSSTALLSEMTEWV